MIKNTSFLIISIVIHSIIFFSLVLLWNDITSKVEKKLLDERISVHLFPLPHIEKQPKIKTVKVTIKQTTKKHAAIKKKIVINKNSYIKKEIIKIDNKKIYNKQVKNIPSKIKKEIPKSLIQENNIKPNSEKIDYILVKASTTNNITITQNKTEKYMKNNIATIRALIEENLYYPRSAKRKGITGKVVVKFKLSKNGDISFISITSSTHEILSRSAIKTLTELSGQFPKSDEDLIIKIPIEYYLKN